MDNTPTTRYTLGVLTVILVGLAAWTPCSADLAWFDETGGGRGFERFTDLANSYHDFLGKPSNTITFNDLEPGTPLSDQYAKAYGVTFLNTASGCLDKLSGAWPEGSKPVRELAGYDGSYMPDGDTVYVKFGASTKDAPFTIVFAEPVDTVGAFISSGNWRNSVNTLTLAAYDQKNRLIGTHSIRSSPLVDMRRSAGNESFFAARADTPQISRVEIVDYSATNLASGLVVDNVAYNVARIPEPSTLAALMSGLWLLLGTPEQRRR